MVLSLLFSKLTGALAVIGVTAGLAMCGLHNIEERGALKRENKIKTEIAHERVKRERELNKAQTSLNKKYQQALADAKQAQQDSLEKQAVIKALPVNGDAGECPINCKLPTLRQ